MTAPFICPLCGQPLSRSRPDLPSRDKNRHVTMWPTVIVRHTTPCPPK